MSLMKREFSLNLFLLLGLNIIVKPLYIFGIDVKVQNEIGPEEYGIYFTLFNFTLLFNVFLEFGITNLVKRNIAEDPKLVSIYFKQLMGLKIILSILFITTVLVAFSIVGFPVHYLKPTIYVMFIQLFISFILFNRSIIAGLGHYKLDSILSVVDRVLLIGMLGALLYFPVSIKMNLILFLQIYLCTLILTYLLSFIKVSKWVSLGRQIDQPITKPKHLLSALAPYALITVLMSFYMKLDPVLLDRLTPNGNYHAGVYAAGFRILDAYLIFSLLFANLALPMLTKKITEPKDWSDLFLYIFKILASLTIIFGIGGFVYSYEISHLLYHNADQEWVETLKLLCLTMIPMGLSMLSGTALVTLNKLSPQIIWMTLAIVINIVLNFYLIPIWLSTGTALTAFVVNSFIFSCQYYLLTPYIITDHRNIISWKLLMLTIFSIIIFFAFSQIGSLPWIIQLLSGGIVCLGFAFLLRLLPRFKLSNFILKNYP